MNLNDIFIIIVMAIIIIFYIQYQNVEVEYVVSDIDGRRYLVKNMEDKKKAANMLANLNRNIQKLITAMQSKYPNDVDVERLKNNYDPNSISEGTDKTNYTSYSINKGEKIVFCLRSRDKQEKLVSFNVLLYVAIHELSHLMTKEIGHPPIFWDNFKKLLQVAIDNKIYIKTDYKKEPVEYCGLTIKSSIL